MYKILFVDEQQDDIDEFKNYVDRANLDVDVEIVDIFPAETLDETVEMIFQINPDVLITDFMLNEFKLHIKYTVPFDGVQLAERILSIRKNFPCFVMTSYDDQAIQSSEDVNIVYVKAIMHNSEEITGAKVRFIDRVINQIDHYRKKQEDAKKELQELIDKKKSGKASIKDEEKINELDTFIEVSIDQKSKVPNDMKKIENTDRLKSLHEKLDTLLSAIEKK